MLFHQKLFIPQQLVTEGNFEESLFYLNRPLEKRKNFENLSGCLANEKLKVV